MAYPPLSLEAAFKQEIESITETDDLIFTKKHFLFVNSYRCKQEAKPQQCIEDGRELYSKFIHGSKLAKQQASYCMAKCSEDYCYQECKTRLQDTISSLTSKLNPVMDDYLLTFAPQAKFS